MRPSRPYRRQDRGPRMNAGTIIAAVGILLWAGTLIFVAVASVTSAPESRTMMLLFVHCFSYPILGAGVALDARLSGATPRQAIRRALLAIFDAIMFP